MLWPWLTCEGRTSTLHHEEEDSSNCRQKITRQVMNTCAGCCNTTCKARATPHKIGRQSLHLTLREGYRAHACASRVNISWQPCTGTRWRTIGGGIPHQKQVIGEDADLEKIGGILNRVIKGGRDGITIEVDQRQVKEILKDLDLEQANHAATPRNVDKKNDNNAWKQREEPR